MVLDSQKDPHLSWQQKLNLLLVQLQTGCQEDLLCQADIDYSSVNWDVSKSFIVFDAYFCMRPTSKASCKKLCSNNQRNFSLCSSLLLSFSSCGFKIFKSNQLLSGDLSHVFISPGLILYLAWWSDDSFLKDLMLCIFTCQ